MYDRLLCVIIKRVEAVDFKRQLEPKSAKEVGSRMTEFTPEFFKAREAAMAALDGFQGMDDFDPKGPTGHVKGLRVSSRLTSDYRNRIKGGTVDVTPQEVVDCLNQAHIKDWVLMGLHAYVGYLPQPRATQDVNIVVPRSQRSRTAQAIAARWPMLRQVSSPQVVRFLDPTDLDFNGEPQPVIDIMLPWSKFQETILKNHVLVDLETQSRYPTLEAALVSKYAALISPHRTREKKEYDAGDFRRIARANHERIDAEKLQSLANEIWDRGGEDILLFIRLTLEHKPLPI